MCFRISVLQYFDYFSLVYTEASLGTLKDIFLEGEIKIWKGIGRDFRALKYVLC